jgi:hypothetical protein
MRRARIHVIETNNAAVLNKGCALHDTAFHLGVFTNRYYRTQVDRIHDTVFELGGMPASFGVTFSARYRQSWLRERA